MSEKRKVVIEVAQEHIGTVEDVRKALHSLVTEISDDRLRNARGVQILIMA